MTAGSRPPEEPAGYVWLPPASVGLAVVLFAMSLISVVLASALTLGLSSTQTASWIIALYGIPGFLSLAMTWWFRKPLFMAWNIAGVAFIASQAGKISYPEIVGAAMVSGVVIIAIGVAGWNERLSRLIPAPVVFAVVAGTVLPFVVGTFAALGVEPVLIGATILAFLLSHAFLSARIPPVLIALIAGILLAAAAGRFDHSAVTWALPALAITVPEFSLPAVLTLPPVIVPLFLANAYIPSAVVLRARGYDPPERAMVVTAGTGQVVGSLLGPALVGMGALVVALTAGPDAGRHDRRHWSVYVAAAGMMITALAAGIAAEIPALIPVSLLVAAAGLALIGVLGQSLGEIVRGPSRLGPLFAFTITLSGMELFGLGTVFWALAAGTVIAKAIETSPSDSATDSTSPPGAHR